MDGCLAILAVILAILILGILLVCILSVSLIWQEYKLAQVTEGTVTGRYRQERMTMIYTGETVLFFPTGLYDYYVIVENDDGDEGKIYLTYDYWSRIQEGDYLSVP